MRLILVLLALLLPVSATAQRGDILWMKGAHTDAITSLRFSPTTGGMATGGLDGRLRFWDPATGNLTSTVHTSQGAVYAAAFSPNGSSIATAGGTGVRVWDASSHELRAVYTAEEGPAFAVEFSPDGSRMVVGYASGKIIVWDVSTTQPVDTLESHTARVNAVAVSPNGEYFASVAEDFTIVLWNAATGQKIKQTTTTQFAPKSIEFSPDGTRLAAPVFDRIKLLEVPSLAVSSEHNARHSVTIRDVDFSSDGRYLASGSEDMDIPGTILDESLAVTDLAGTKPMYTAQFTQTQGHPTSLEFSPNRRWLAFGTNIGSIVMYDLAPDAAPRLFVRGPYGITGHFGEVRATAISTDGRTVASGGSDEIVRIWDASSGTLLRTLRGHDAEITGLAFSPDDAAVASSAADGTVRVWGVESGGLLTTVYTSAEYPTTSVDFAPDGRRIIAGVGFFDNFAGIWDTTNLLPTQRLLGHTSAVTAVGWIPEGDRVVTGSDDHSLKLWQPSDGSLVVTLTDHAAQVTGIAVARTVSRFASASADRTIRLWESQSGDNLKVHRGHTNGITGIAITADGELIASSSRDKSIRIWSAFGGELYRYGGYDAEHLSVAIHGDSAWVASGSNDGTVILWRLRTASSVGSSSQRSGEHVRVLAPRPNPASDIVSVPLRLERGAVVRAEVIAPDGTRLAQLHDGMLPPGEHLLRWNATSVPSGVYYVRIICNDYVVVQKLSIVSGVR